MIGMSEEHAVRQVDINAANLAAALEDGFANFCRQGKVRVRDSIAVRHRNAQAGVLADNGGDVQTIALNASFTNPALDATTLGGADARGEAREFDIDDVDNGGASDLGAFELTTEATGKETPSLIVTTIEDSYDATDGLTSLREAVVFANSQAGADTITFAAGGQGLIRLTEGEIAITEALTVNGAGAVTITGDAADDDVTVAGDITDVAATGASQLYDNSRIFNSTADLTLDGLTLTGGRIVAYNAYGGAVRSEGSLTLSNTVLAGNSTYSVFGAGTGAFANGDINVSNSLIENNISTGSIVGGAGVASAAEITITDSAIRGNETAGKGGGVFAGGDITITNSEISDNTAGTRGAGIYAYDNVTLVSSVLSGNSAVYLGGGAFIQEKLTAINSTIEGNTSTGELSGGGGASAALLEQAIQVLDPLLFEVVPLADLDRVLEVRARALALEDRDQEAIHPVTQLLVA